MKKHIVITMFIFICIIAILSCSKHNSSGPGETEEPTIVNLNDPASQSVSIKAQRFGQYAMSTFNPDGPYYYEPNGITFTLNADRELNEVPKFSFSINLSEKSEQKPLLQPVTDKNYEGTNVDIIVIEEDGTRCNDSIKAITAAEAGANCTINKSTISIYIDESEWDIPEYCSKSCGDTNEKIGHLSGTLKFDIQYTYENEEGVTNTKEFKYDAPFDLDLMNCPLFCTGE